MYIHLENLTEEEWRTLERCTVEMNAAQLRAGGAGDLAPVAVAMALLRSTLRQRGRLYAKQDSRDAAVIELAGGAGAAQRNAPSKRGA